MKHPLYATAPRHVVWLHTAFLGDMILLTAAMKVLKEKFPEIRQHLITTPLGATALGHLPILDTVYHVPKRGRATVYWKEAVALRKRLRGQGIMPENSLLLRPHASTRSALLALMCRLPTISHRESSLALLSAVRVPRVGILHECSRLALLLEPLGIPREDVLHIRPFLLKSEPDALLERFPGLRKKDRHLVGIAPGSVWGTKRWPVDSFARLTELLCRRHDVSVVLLGSSAEVSVAEELCGRLTPETRKRVLDITGKTSLDELRAVFPLLSLLVSNDSSPVHFASAFNIPTVTLFGATVPAMGFSPLADNSISLGAPELECRPCSDHGPKECPLGHFKCMGLLAPESVAGECLKRLPGAQHQ